MNDNINSILQRLSQTGQDWPDETLTANIQFGVLHIEYISIVEKIISVSVENSSILLFVFHFLIANVKSVAWFFAIDVGCDTTQSCATDSDISILNWSKVA